MLISGAGLVVLLMSVMTPAQAQLVAPLTTSDGKIACLQGITGVGHTTRWEAVKDPVALGGWALSETGGDATDLHFPLCVSTQTIARDVDATLRFKAIGGTHARSAGLIVRGQSANDYYVVRADALEGSVRLYRMVGGRRALIKAQDKADVASDQWHALRVIVKGNNFDVSLDDKPMFKATDSSLPQPGTVGVWSQADSLIHFGSLVVAPPPP
jgi:hypothetical protein